MQATDVIRTGLAASRGVWERALRPDGAPTGPIPEVPRPQLLWRPAPGSHSVGKLLWHIADAEDRFVTQLIYGREFNPPFAIQSLDAEDDLIPAWDEIMDYLQQTRGRTLEALDDLADKLGEERSFFGRPSSIGEIFAIMISHEASHAGQIAHIMGVVRRAGW